MQYISINDCVHKLLKDHLRCLHMGHFSCDDSCRSQEYMQCYHEENASEYSVTWNLVWLLILLTMWKEWWHSPITVQIYC
jgi:hypothetical protein